MILSTMNQSKPQIIASGFNLCQADPQNILLILGPVEIWEGPAIQHNDIVRFKLFDIIRYNLNTNNHDNKLSVFYLLVCLLFNYSKNSS